MSDSVASMIQSSTVPMRLYDIGGNEIAESCTQTNLSQQVPAEWMHVFKDSVKQTEIANAFLSENTAVLQISHWLCPMKESILLFGRDVLKPIRKWNEHTTLYQQHVNNSEQLRDYIGRIGLFEDLPVEMQTKRFPDLHEQQNDVFCMQDMDMNE
jgi:hypothetical protein